MKKTKFVLLAALVSFGLSATAQEFTVDAGKSEIKWDSRKVSGKGHYGTVQVKEGTVNMADNKLSSAEIVVDMNTIINTDGKDGEPNARLVGHLKSDDFFSVDKFETAKFELTGSTEFEDNKAKIYGRLTIKGITHPVNFIAERKGNTLTTNLAVDRTLYDVRYGSGKFFDGLGDNMIKDEFTLDIALDIKEQKNKALTE